MPVKTWTVKNLAAVGEFFGVPVSTCEYWRKQGLPGEPGRWDLGEISRWRIGKLDNAGDLNSRLKLADIRLKRAMTRQKNLDYDVQRGDLVDRGDVERWASMALIEAREMLMQLPEMLGSSVAPEVKEFVRSEADRHVRATLSALRRRLEARELQGQLADDATESQA